MFEEYSFAFDVDDTLRLEKKKEEKYEDIISYTKNTAKIENLLLKGIDNIEKT